MAARGQRCTARACAARIVQQVLYRGLTLDTALADTLPAARPEDRGFIQEMSYGAVRWAQQLQVITADYAHRPIKDDVIAALLLVGSYQLMYMRIPAHAVVMETVDAADALGKPATKGLVNAVLRHMQRDVARLSARISQEPDLLFSHPDWLLTRLQSAWPQHWQAICHANNARPPMSLRVNVRRLTRDAYLGKLSVAGMHAMPLAGTDSGMKLEPPCAVSQLPGFADGDVSVQDGAAQLAAGLLDAHAGQRVLDACAAPGGKACHVLESADVDLVAVERDPERTALINDNLQRLGLKAVALTADAADPAGWWDGREFQRILIDAPCSASGVIRRHPDIKIHRRPGDIAASARVQHRLLTQLWPLLAPGGKLLYATCSILPEENETQVTRFLHDHADAEEAPLAMSIGHRRQAGVQLLPGEYDLDGFYYASLRKKS